jgi:hypothetical protein
VTWRRPEPAEAIGIVGDFQGWDAKASLLFSMGADGAWRASIEFPLDSNIQYKLLSDGQFLTDPHAPETQDDGFGGRNGVIPVRLISKLGQEGIVNPNPFIRVEWRTE